MMTIKNGPFNKRYVIISLFITFVYIIGSYGLIELFSHRLPDNFFFDLFLLPFHIAYAFAFGEGGLSFAAVLFIESVLIALIIYAFMVAFNTLFTKAR